MTATKRGSISHSRQVDLTKLEIVMLEVILILLVAVSMLSSAFFFTLVCLAAICLMPPRWSYYSQNRSYFLLLALFAIAVFESSQFHLFIEFVWSGVKLDFERIYSSVSSLFTGHPTNR